MAETFVVRFIDVGARHLSWEERLPRPVDENQIVEAVRRKRALASRGIDAEFTGDSDYAGTIYGGFRPVGRFLIVPGSNAEAQAASSVVAEDLPATPPEAP